jgi:hypothetical protein
MVTESFRGTFYLRVEESVNEGNQRAAESKQGYDTGFMLVSGKQSGYWELFLGVKRPRHEAEHSLPSSTEVKNNGVISPLRHTSSWLCALLRCRDNFAFYHVMALRNNPRNKHLYSNVLTY